MEQFQHNFIGIFINKQRWAYFILGMVGWIFQELWLFSLISLNIIVSSIKKQKPYILTYCHYFLSIWSISFTEPYFKVLRNVRLQ